MMIRESRFDELPTILSVELDAFSQDEEIREIVSGIHHDETARPLISLLAFEGAEAIGHIYLTHAIVENQLEECRCMILAPLAVIRSRQKTGVGLRLIREALARSKEMGVHLVFVLGHPSYYPRSGFVPAGKYGLVAPYPIEEKNAGAWMVQELETGVLARTREGKVVCAQALMKPEYWRE